MIGIIVTVNGMLSTAALANAETHITTSAVTSSFSGSWATLTSCWPNRSRRPDPSTPPTMMKSPAKNNSTAQSISLRNSSGSGRTRARATATPTQAT